MLKHYRGVVFEGLAGRRRRLYTVDSGNKKELDQKDRRDDIGHHRHLLSFAGKQFDRGIRDQAQADPVADGAGHRHGKEHQTNAGRYAHTHTQGYSLHDLFPDIQNR